MVIDFESTVKLSGKEVPLRQQILKDYETSYCHHDAFCCSGGDVCQLTVGELSGKFPFPASSLSTRHLSLPHVFRLPIYFKKFC